jgi:hypothetical protein
MNRLVNDLQWGLSNINVLTQAVFLNQLLEAIGQKSLTIGTRTIYHKPLHILKPKNLKSMTISLQDVRIQKEYFDRGQKDVARLARSLGN